VPGREQATLEDFTLLDRGIAVQERVDADSRVRLLAGGRWQPVAAVAATGAA
jgi:oligopeptidase B